MKNIYDDFFQYFSCVADAHPIAIRLNKLLKEGKIPEDCLYYKYVDNTTQYALADARSSSEFKWDDDLCEFYETKIPWLAQDA